MDIEIKQKKYRVPRKYWPWIGGGVIVIALLVWLAQSNFTSSLQVDERGLSIATVENAQFNDYVSVDGNVVVFETGGKLFSYNIATNKLALLFSYYDENHDDARDRYDQHAIRILDVDEGGNVMFSVYGYANRGRHEGQVGIQLFR